MKHLKLQVIWGCMFLLSSCALTRQSKEEITVDRLKLYLGNLMHNYYLIHYDFPSGIPQLELVKDSESWFFDEVADSLLFNNIDKIQIMEKTDTLIRVCFQDNIMCFQDSITLDEINNSMRRVSIWGFDNRGNQKIIEDHFLKKQVIEVEQTELKKRGINIPQFRNMPYKDGGPLMIIIKYLPQQNVLDLVPSCKFAKEKIATSYLNSLKRIFMEYFSEMDFESVFIPIMYIE